MSDQHHYLFIGGSTKCGTTSVFNYFEFHPEVCPCVMKESRYFWGNDYPLFTNPRNSELPKSFSGLFKNCSDRKLRIEATPDYLYSNGIDKRIKSELTNVKWVFILRNPVDRMLSWFQYASINKMLDSRMSFAEYCEMQLHATGEMQPQHLRSLEQGKYFRYIKQFFDAFGKENVKMMLYEDLSKDPLSFSKEICRFANIDENYFNNYDFRIYNKSGARKSANMHLLFRKLKRSVRPVTRQFPDNIRKRLKLAGHSFESLYASVNSNKVASDNTLPFDLTEELKKYYAADMEAISELIGKPLPWNISNFNK